MGPCNSVATAVTGSWTFGGNAAFQNPMTGAWGGRYTSVTYRNAERDKEDKIHEAMQKANSYANSLKYKYRPHGYFSDRSTTNDTTIQPDVTTSQRGEIPYGSIDINANKNFVS